MTWLISQALMNSLCLQGQEEESLEENCLDGELSVPLSGNNTQQAYCAPDKMTKFSRLSRFGMTYKPLTENRGEKLLTLYLEDFHARTLAQPVKVQELKETNHQCGNTWQGSLARLDPSTSLWRTAQCSLLEDLELSLQTFPKWGLMQNGALYQLPTLVQTISERGFGLGQYVTPTTRDYKGMSGSGFRERHGINHNLADCLGGVPNPMFSEWLMAFPPGWTDLRPLEMDKCLYVQQLHGSCLNE